MPEDTGSIEAGLTARVYVTPKRGILDPQGKTVQHALGSLGYEEVTDVRVGRYIVLRLQGTDADVAHDRVRRMCEQLLANGVVEDYRIEVSSTER